MALAVYGSNIFYFLTLAGTALILLLAANTSYADFPRLAALIAGDGFLPRQLTIKGSRLVFSWGIVSLGILASLLVVFFRAETSALIPLYAIGVFLSFTLSQAGMAVHTWRAGKMKPGEVIESDSTVMRYDPAWRPHMVLSAFGAVVTGIVMIVFAVTKFALGAWFVVVLIPVLVFAFYRIHAHYKDVASLLSLSGKRPKHQIGPVMSLLFIEDVHAGAMRMVDYAKSLGCGWKAVHVAVNPDKADIVKQKWTERIGEGELIVLPSPYRQLTGPIRDFVESELERLPEGYVNVILGHLAMDTPWEQALHQNSAIIFNIALQGLERVAVTNVPYQIHHLRRNGINGATNGTNGPANGK
jgi:hypothetical protein